MIPNHQFRMFLGLTILFATALTACSRGRNTPADYDDKTVLKYRCGAPLAFNPENEIQSRTEKVLAQSAGNPEASPYVVKTTVRQEHMVNDAEYAALIAEEAKNDAAKGLTPVENKGVVRVKSAAEVKGSEDMIVFQKDCPTLRGSLIGAGVAEALGQKNSDIFNPEDGRINGIISKVEIDSIEMEDADRGMTVKLEKVAPDEKSQKVILGKDDKPVPVLMVTITQKLNNTEALVTTVRQELVVRQ